MSCTSSNAINRHISSAASLPHRCQPNNLDIRRRQIHFSSSRQQATVSNDVKVTISSNNNSAPTDNTNDSTTPSSGSSCSQGISLDTDNDDEEEEEQEDMFVTADPILGHGTIKEWGGPRRGGSLAEPTRFGDWERKGRCTDF